MHAITPRQENWQQNVYLEKHEWIRCGGSVRPSSKSMSLDPIIITLQSFCVCRSISSTRKTCRNICATMWCSTASSFHATHLVLEQAENERREGKREEKRKEKNRAEPLVCTRSYETIQQKSNNIFTFAHSILSSHIICRIVWSCRAFAYELDTYRVPAHRAFFKSAHVCLRSLESFFFPVGHTSPFNYIAERFVLNESEWPIIQCRP